MGDVSGKGIPASLFMVRASTLVRLLGRQIREPSVILATLNDELEADNPSGMFVTVLCAIYERTSRRLTLSNGGQCRPVLLRAGEPPAWAFPKLGTALGLAEGMKFEQIDMILHPGDTIVLYTDGVSEAFNARDECYGDERLLAGLATSTGNPAAAVTAALLRSVRAFADGTPQSDDIAALVLRVADTPAVSAQ
jgi:sigma-B regulation protein RsbU (phosphoserine phosphatase)